MKTINDVIIALLLSVKKEERNKATAKLEATYKNWTVKSIMKSTLFNGPSLISTAAPKQIKV